VSVIRRSPEPSVRTEKRSKWPRTRRENAIRDPSGDQAGSSSGSLPAVTRRSGFDPSSGIT